MKWSDTRQNLEESISKLKERQGHLSRHVEGQIRKLKLMKEEEERLNNNIVKILQAYENIDLTLQKYRQDMKEQLEVLQENDKEIIHLNRVKAKLIEDIHELKEQRQTFIKDIADEIRKEV